MRQSTVERCQKVSDLVKSGMPIYKARKKIGVGTASWIKYGMSRSEIKRSASLKAVLETPLVLPTGGVGLAKRILDSNLGAQDKLSLLSSVIV
jgi:hypothetical protein